MVLRGTLPDAGLGRHPRCSLTAWPPWVVPLHLLPPRELGTLWTAVPQVLHTAWSGGLAHSGGMRNTGLATGTQRADPCSPSGYSEGSEKGVGWCFPTQKLPPQPDPPDHNQGAFQTDQQRPLSQA